jgi:hypothetical protein
MSVGAGTNWKHTIGSHHRLMSEPVAGDISYRVPPHGCIPTFPLPPLPLCARSSSFATLNFPHTVYTDTQAGTCGCEARQGREGRGEAWEREGGYDTRNEAQLYRISVLRFVSFILPLRFAVAFIFPLSLLLPLPLPLLD